VTFPFSFIDSDGEEVSILGPSSWSPTYYSVLVGGVPTVRSAALVQALIHPRTKENEMARTKDKIVDQNVGEGTIIGDDPALTDAQQKAQDENHELSVDDDDSEHTTDENQEIVNKATAKSAPEKKDEPKDKVPTTGEVAGAWIHKQLEEGPKTKAELIELAAKTNPAKFENPKGKDRPKVPRSTKWIVEHKKTGDMCPGNAGGHYINEGLDSRKGGVDVLIDEETKALSLKS
jgi:hypothetical protein